MGKRKKSQPQRANDEKRRLMTWNLYDCNQGNQGSLSICADNDPELLKEQQNDTSNGTTCANSASTSNGDSNVDITDNKEIQAVFDSYLKTCSHCVTVRRDLYVKENDWCAMIGLFSINIEENHSMFELNSECFDEIDEFWLYVGLEGFKSFIYTENSSLTEKKQCKFWCISSHVPAEVKYKMSLYNVHTKCTGTCIIYMYMYMHGTIRKKTLHFTLTKPSEVTMVTIRLLVSFSRIMILRSTCTCMVTMKLVYAM